MPLPYHLIDGYNLLHAAGLARARYGPGDLERARVALLLKIADGLSEDDRGRTTVVFDAAEPPTNVSDHLRFRELSVLFAVGFPDADTLIEDLIRRHASPRQLRVVSDDLRIKAAGRRRGSQAVSTEAFLARLQRHSPGRTRPSAVAPAAPPAEDSVDGWLDYFGLEGEQSLAKTVPPPDLLPEPTAPAPTAPIPTTPGRAEQSPKPDAPKSLPPVTPLASKPGRVTRGGAPAIEPAGDDDLPRSDVDYWQSQIDALLAAEHPPGTPEGGSPRRPAPGSRP